MIGKYLRPLIAHNKHIINNTQEFPQLLKSQPPLGEDEEYVSYDVESLFTNIPIEDTIKYIIKKIYVEDKLPKICTQLIFTRLLTKLTKESTFLFQGQLYKQSNGCTMGGPLSVTIADIYMTKLEESVVIPTNPTFYRRYVDDSFNRRKKGNQDTLFDAMNKVHTNINFTVEVNPTKLLDTEIVMKGANVETKLIHKETKLPTHWSTKTPKKFKRNAINGNFHTAWMISSNFEAEVKILRDRFLTAKYPLKFINSVIKKLP